MKLAARGVQKPSHHQIVELSGMRRGNHQSVADVRDAAIRTEVRVPPYIFLSALALVCSVPVLISAMILIARHVSQRRLSLGSTESADIISRLERIEQTIDASALELERIAEGNRFVAKLLAEKSDGTPR
jgi:hypothetical protein